MTAPTTSGTPPIPAVSATTQQEQIVANEETIGQQNLDIRHLHDVIDENCRLMDEMKHLGRYVEMLNDDLNTRNSQLSAANKELESFNYAVSHDLRTPLRSMEAYAEQLLESAKEKLDDNEKMMGNKVIAAVQRMSILIDDLLKLSRLNKTELIKKETNLSALARTILDEIVKEKPSRNLVADVQDNLVIHADPGLMSVVLENLIRNAWKYSAGKNPVRISFSAVTESTRTIFCVQDNGVGFDMKYVNKLFAPFQRLHSLRDFAGNGIGLATVSRIIHRHGGTVWAEAQIGVGAKFYFTLPLKTMMKDK